MTDRPLTALDRAHALARERAVPGTLAADGFYEVRPADYRDADSLVETATVHAIIQRTLDEARPYRLILKEGPELVHPKRNALEPLEYRIGPNAIYVCSAETVILRQDGRRYMLRKGEYGHSERGYA